MHRPSSSNVASVRRENLLLSTPMPLFWIGFGSIEKNSMEIISREKELIT